MVSEKLRSPNWWCNKQYSSQSIWVKWMKQGWYWTWKDERVYSIFQSFDWLPCRFHSILDFPILKFGALNPSNVNNLFRRLLTFVNNMLAKPDKFKEFCHTKCDIYDTNRTEKHRRSHRNCIWIFKKIIGTANNEQKTQTYADDEKQKTRYYFYIEWKFVWTDAHN